MRKDNREAANESIRQAGDPAMLEDLLIYLAKRCNTAALESDVRELQITLNQKTAGQPQYAKSGDINVDVNFDRVRMCILQCRGHGAGWNNRPPSGGSVARSHPG